MHARLKGDQIVHDERGRDPKEPRSDVAGRCEEDIALSARGHATFEAASGSHDDLVMALCLAVWWGERDDPLDAWLEVNRRRRLAAGR